MPPPRSAKRGPGRTRRRLSPGHRWAQTKPGARPVARATLMNGYNQVAGLWNVPALVAMPKKKRIQPRCMWDARAAAGGGVQDARAAAGGGCATRKVPLTHPMFHPQHQRLPPPVSKNQQCLTAEPGVGSCAHFSP